jgi:hypothetical protein
VTEDDAKFNGTSMLGREDTLPHLLSEEKESSPIPIDILRRIDSIGIDFTIQILVIDLSQFSGERFLQIFLSHPTHVSVQTFREEGISTEE